MPSAFNSSLDLQKYQPCLLSKQWQGTISWGLRCRTVPRRVATAVFPLCCLGTPWDGIILLGLERMGHFMPAVLQKALDLVRATSFCFAKEPLQAKLHGPGLDFPRPALGGRKQWDGCLLGRGWAAPVDKGDCCRGCFISVEHDPVGIHVFLLGEGRRTLIEPQFHTVV